jgi:hypothetical protein
VIRPLAEASSARGDVAFAGDLTPAPDANLVIGVFRYSGGVTIPIARPGDAMPGGGHFVTGSNVGGAQIHVNNQGDIVFNAELDTDVNHDGVPDTGVFQWSHGQLSLVARTGTNIPGVGEVQDMLMNVILTPPPPNVSPNSGALNNDRGQVLFGARLTDGRSVLLLYTPSAGVAHLAVASDVVGELPDPEKRAEDFVTQTDREANRKKGQDERDWLDARSAISP